MKELIIIKSRDLKVTPSIESYIFDKLGKLQKFKDFIREIIVEVKIERRDNKKMQGISINIAGIHKKNFHEEEFADNLYEAIDKLSDNILRQVRKYKEKIEFKRKHETLKNSLYKNDIFKKEKEEKIVKIKRFEMKPMFEEEAFLQMKQLGHNFFMYFDAMEENIKVIRKTKQEKGYEVINIFEDNPITEKQALELIDELEYDFVAYFDINLDKPRIIYRRKDNKFGVIEPIQY